jgi:hypothetical protein
MENYHIITFPGYSLPETETNARCFPWKQNNLEVIYSPIWISGRGGGVFLEETPYGKSYSVDYKQKQKEQHSFKIGTWNIRTLNQEGKLKNLKKEMQKNVVSVLGVSEVQ